MNGIAGARFRIITGRDPDVVPGKLELGRSALELLEAHLSDREWLVCDTPTIADLSNFAYVHVAPDAGLGLDEHPAVAAWLRRVQALSGFINDLAPYPPTRGPARAARSTTPARDASVDVAGAPG